MERFMIIFTKQKIKRLSSMKKLIPVLLLAMLLIVPQSSHADSTSFSLDPGNVYVSVGSTFSVNLNIYYDYSYYNSLGYAAYWLDWGGGFNEFYVNYNENIIDLVSATTPVYYNTEIRGDDTFSAGLNDPYANQMHPNSYSTTLITLTFKALQTGYTDLTVSGSGSGDFVQGDACNMGMLSFSALTLSTVNVPEPATMLLLGLGLLGLIGARRKIQK